MEHLYYVATGKPQQEQACFEHFVPFKEALAYYRSEVRRSKQDGVRPWSVVLYNDGCEVVYIHQFRKEA
jgi:hypothetical protein